MFVILIVRLTRFFRYMEIVFCIDKKSSTTSKSCRIWPFNNLGFCWSDTWLFLTALIYYQQNIEHQRHSTWSLFASWQTGLRARNCPCLNHWQGTWYIEMDMQDCQILQRQGKTALKNFLPLKMVYQLVILGLNQSWLIQCCKWDFGWLSR